MTTLREFLAGESLEAELPEAKFKKKLRTRTWIVTYRAGVGAILERDDEGTRIADVTEDLSARRLYWNLTRETQT